MRAEIAVFMLTAAASSGAELILPAAALERDRAITAVYRTNPQATGRGSLHIEWTDILGRVVEDRTIPIEMSDETEIRFDVDLTRAVAMSNQIRAHLVLDGANKKGAADHRDESASVSFVARPADRGWSDYMVIMWQPHGAERFAKLTTLGINAGQYSGRAKNPPDFLLKNDLRWYAENIATDFYAEYHRFRPDRGPNWSYLQAKALYRRDPTSNEAFKRHPSLSDPAWLNRIRERLSESARANSPYRPLFYDLGDESGIADLAAYWDFDFSDQSLAEMRAWLMARYGTLAALNRQWGSDVASWDAVTPDTTSQAMKRTDENYSSWADHKEWMDVSFARAIKMGVDAIRSVDPDARAGIAGAQMPGWGGYDYWRLSQALNAIEPYDIGDNIEILRSLNPAVAFVTTAFARGPWEKHRIWYELLHGARGNIIWDDKAEHVAADGSIGERGREASLYYNELRDGIGALLIASTRQSDPIAIHYSQASMRTEWMLAQRPKGDAWVNRTSSTERMDSQFLWLRESYCKLIEDLGLQYNFVAYAQVEQGELLRRGYRVLILPRSTSLSAAEAKAIHEFAEQGGIVIADGEPGTFDEHSRRLPRPRLADLFGPDGAGRGRAVRFDAARYHELRLAGKEGPVLEAMRGLIQAAVQPAFAVVDESNRPVSGVEVHRFRNGGMTIVGLLSNPQLRVDELGPPEFISNRRFEKPQVVRLRLPNELYAYDIRGSKALGRKKELSLTLDPYEPTVLAFSATPLPELRVGAPARVRRGDTAHIALSFGDATPARTYVVHVDVSDPSGAAASQYTSNVIVAGGAADKPIPFAVNDTPGKWTVRVKDLLSAQQATMTIDVL